MSHDERAQDLISVLGRGADNAPAIGAPGRPAMTHAELRKLITDTISRLNASGIGRGDRVAIVLPNGPEMATAFLATASAATAAPLNPAYRADEYRFYLTDLNAMALIVQRGVDTDARDVAKELGVPVIELDPDSAAGAGSFSLDLSALSGKPPAAKGGKPAPDDVALVLHTSGTTSRPKIVPLTHRNLAATAGNIAATLGLRPDDVCLNIMPLFHIHGLMAAVIASLGAGGEVVCTPGFNALKFFAWLKEANPTWYTAVPTMHQAILARADRNKDVIAGARLRLIRSSSASLPRQVMTAMEEAFGAPVVESYGMTEAAHQMTSNPMPPRPRKPGSVGLAAGPEVAIMAPDGSIVTDGGRGEVVIRGPNVTPGYESNPEANATAFHDGWFRTGDQGELDSDGYLWITGRLKELINRGGEKVSPLEVDEVLMDHPGVAQAVTFALPHDKLGEEVAAAIVVRDGQQLTESDLRDFAKTRLADFKVPRKIVILDEIPKGPTGKMQRIGLAEKLGLTQPSN
jgi:acyl-CoA synthetase (AMP-forming)/AMP-acid ligase II